MYLVIRHLFYWDYSCALEASILFFTSGQNSFTPRRLRDSKWILPVPGCIVYLESSTFAEKCVRRPGLAANAVVLDRGLLCDTSQLKCFLWDG